MLMQFYQTYREQPKLAAMLGELSWSHNFYPEAFDRDLKKRHEQPDHGTATGNRPNSLPHCVGGALRVARRCSAAGDVQIGRDTTDSPNRVPTHRRTSGSTHIAQEL
jgi:hypothetical protein